MQRVEGVVDFLCGVEEVDRYAQVSLAVSGVDAGLT
jgi:hypothetical protein